MMLKHLLPYALCNLHPIDTSYLNTDQHNIRFNDHISYSSTNSKTFQVVVYSYIRNDNMSLCIASTLTPCFSSTTSNKTDSHKQNAIL